MEKLPEATKRAKPAPPPLPPGWTKPDPNKPAIPPGVKVPVASAPATKAHVATAPSPKAPTAGYDPMSSKYAGGSADRRAAKKIFNAVEDFESGTLKASDPRHKEIGTFAQKQFKLVGAFIKKKFGLPYFDIKASLVWDGAAEGITAGTDMQGSKPFCFFDFSRYYKYPGELNQYKWKRLEYDDMDTDPIIGSVYKASWQDCVTISICHEFSHAIQSCKDIDVLQKVVAALPKYKGNCDDGLHGEFFKAIYRCIRGNIMGTKKEERYLSFGQFMDEVKKPEEKKREIRLPKLPPKITEPELVSLDTNK